MDNNALKNLDKEQLVEIIGKLRLDQRYRKASAGIDPPNEFEAESEMPEDDNVELGEAYFGLNLSAINSGPVPGGNRNINRGMNDSD